MVPSFQTLSHIPKLALRAAASAVASRSGATLKWSILRQPSKKDRSFTPRRPIISNQIAGTKETPIMTMQHTRREILKGSLALAGLGALGEWPLPALAQGETEVPFTDIPANANFTPAADRRTFDIRKIDGPFTPKDQFFTTQHYGHPDVDLTTYRLKVS